jgi:nucleoside 2-deoxyribosyltransferase
MKKTKVYIATPVNGRKEKNLAEKQKGALKRVVMISDYLKRNFPEEFGNAEFQSSFSFVAIGEKMSESVVMGTCVRMVMECDMIILDEGWAESQGCTVERFVALQYGKAVKAFPYYQARLSFMRDVDEAAVGF